MTSKCTLCKSDDLSFIKYISYSKLRNIIQYIIRVLFIFTPNSIISKLPLKLKIILSKGIWKNNLKIIKCNNCGFGYVKYIPKMQDLEIWYNSYGQTKNLTKKREIRGDDQFKYLDKFIDFNTIKSVLDYGCGNFPYTIKKIYEKNENIIINASDISKQTCHLLETNHFISKVYNTDTPKSIKGSFDLIILSHIINHVENIYKFFDELLTIVNTNGLLCIEFRNSSDDYYNVNKVHHPFTNFFNLKSFEIFIKNYNLKIIEKNQCGPSNRDLYLNGKSKHYLENENGIYIRYILKKTP